MNIDTMPGIMTAILSPWGNAMITKVLQTVIEYRNRKSLDLYFWAAESSSPLNFLCEKIIYYKKSVLLFIICNQRIPNFNSLEVLYTFSEGRD